jgi:FtsP/CotA-like multicopper oxidase with cupredoxin domain
MLEQRKDNAIYKYTIFFSLAMQALVIVLASLIVAFAALSLASNYELFAQRQQTCKDRNTGDYLTSFSCGNVRLLENGTTVRNYTLLAEEIHQIPITLNNNSMEQTIFPAWTYNGSVPGPTLRMNEGDLVHITVTNSPQSESHHSLHMHSIHEPAMDGTFGPSANIAPGESFTYKFTAGPAGLYPYHCHVEPVQDHINRGLYGAMIIDPKVPREPANEMMMLMNSYDLDLNEEMAPTVRPPNADEGRQILYPPVKEENEENEDAAEEGDDQAGRPELELERDNEFYTVNGKAFEYMQEPIKIKLGEPVRLYLVNMIEFDPVNNFHLHSGMFNYTASGTEGTPPTVTDIVTLSQGDRGLIEFTPTNKGMMMIHSHINEFSQLGWMGAFEVV